MTPITKLLILLSLTMVAVVTFAQDQPDDYAVVVRDTRLFAGLEPYSEILGRAEAGQYFPALSQVEDQYGIQWAEVLLPDGDRAFLSDVIIMREKKPALQKLLKMVNLADINMWDEETLREVQRSGVEAGFSATQVLFAKGVPLLERKNDGCEEWFYLRLVVLLKDNEVIGFTDVNRLPQDKLIEIVLGAEDPEFEMPSGQWQTVETAVSAISKTAGGAPAPAKPKKALGSGAVGVFRVPVPVDGTYRLSARWPAEASNSTNVSYKVLQRRKEIAVLKANQRLYNDRWIYLGDVNLESGPPVVIRITAPDGGPFYVDTVRIKYLNAPLLSEAEGSANSGPADSVKDGDSVKTNK